MMKKMAFSVAILMMILLFSGCQGKTELKMGKYHLDGNSENFTYVLLDEEGNFEFSRGMALSYRPMGTYEVEGEELILKANVEEEYLFVIQGDELIFQGEIEGILENGSRFMLEKTKQ
jgi:hypothetical protein